MSTSALAEELIEEGLRVRRHPMIVSVTGSGRRAGLIGGPEAGRWSAGSWRGRPPRGPHRPSGRAPRIAHQQIDAVLNYYADFTTEIDEEIPTTLQ